MDSIVKFTTTRDVKHPVRGTTEAAGIDFYIPYNTGSFLADFVKKNEGSLLRYKTDTDGELCITILPKHRVLIPSGIRTSFEPGSALIAANKSGVSSKKGLVFTAQVIDSDYDGEIHIGVVNTSDEPVSIKTGDKLIQFIHTPVILSKLEYVDSDIITTEHKSSVRGNLGFGECTGNQ